MARRLNIAGIAGAGLVSAIAGATAVNRALVRRMSRRPDTVSWSELELPDDLVEHTLTMSDGWECAAIEAGPVGGPVVVLLHGITLGAEIWSYQLSGLSAAGCRVISLDMRGHGHSDQAGDDQKGPAPAMTLDRMAEDVAEALQQLDLEQVTLVGHSMGGMVALKMLGADWDLAAGRGRVASLVLAGTTANATSLRGIPGLSDAVALAAPVITSASGLAARLPGPTLPANDIAFLLARVTFGERPSPRQVSFTGKMTSRVPVRVSAGLLLEIIRFNAEAVLPDICLPTTVVVGDHDLMTPPSQSEYLASHIAGAELIVLEGCGHMLMLERPEELNKAILARALP